MSLLRSLLAVFVQPLEAPIVPALPRAQQAARITYYPDHPRAPR